MIEPKSPKSIRISYYPVVFTCPVCKKTEELEPFTFSKGDSDPVFDVVTYASHNGRRFISDHEMCVECTSKVKAFIDSLKTGS